MRDTCSRWWPERRREEPGGLTGGNRTTERKNAAALAREGLLVPASYQQACANEGFICLTSGSGAGRPDGRSEFLQIPGAPLCGYVETRAVRT